MMANITLSPTSSLEDLSNCNSSSQAINTSQAGCDTGHTSTISVFTSTISAYQLEWDVVTWLWRTCPAAMLVLGLLGNSLTLVVLVRLGLKGQPTMTFLFFLAITDSVVLLTGLPRYWVVYVFDFDIRRTSDISCKLYYFSIYTSQQFSSWILVGVSVERVIKTYLPFRYKRMYTSKRVVFGLFIMLIILCGVNLHFFFTNGINEYTEGSCSSLTPDYFAFDEYVFVYVDLTIFSLVPFVIMSISNILLIRVLRRVQRERSEMMHESMVEKANQFSMRMTKMLVVCTAYFLTATAPLAIYFVVDSYLYPAFEETGNEGGMAYMDVAWAVTYVFNYSNYCVNFYLYTAMNDRFYQELRTVLCCQDRCVSFGFLLVKLDFNLSILG